MDYVHKIKYVIEFKEPVDYFDIILQKQIKLRLKFDGDEKHINLLEIEQYNERLYNSIYYQTYKNYFTSHDIHKSFLELNNSSNKCEIIQHIYNLLKKNDYDDNLLRKEPNNIIISYEEFEFNFELMLEEFLVFCNNFKFNNDEENIINSFTNDETIKSNIKFCGWKDYWAIY